MMRKWTYLSALLLLIPGSLVASSKPYKKSFTLREPVQVENLKLAPGHYQAVWDRAGDNVPVAILQHGKPIATLQARVVKRESPYDRTADYLVKQPSGPKRLLELEFAKTALIFNQSGIVNR